MPVLSLVKLKNHSLPIPGAEPWHAAPDDPARSVMTDFSERASVTTSENATIDEALDHMKHTGVRCAFAVDAEKKVVVGLITAYDITSEKPTRHMQTVSGKRGEVLVRDIMQRIEDWQVVNIADIERSTVAAVARLFETCRLTHIPVMETRENGERRLRGLLSAARVKRLLSTG
jgi:CBS domain-containing protein